MDEKPIVTVTRDGRTLVDANQLFETKDVKEFMESVKKFQMAELVQKRRGRLISRLGRTSPRTRRYA
jgi:hypothetical protein